MVKYADGPRAEVEIEIDAPTAAVWPLLVDIQLPSRFSPELRTAEWIDDGPAGGARFRGYNRHPAVGEWDVLCTITDYVSGSAFEWTVGDVENKTARWRFDLAPLDDDRSALRFSAEMGPGPSGLTPVIERMPEREEDIVANRLGDWTANMQLTVDGIAALAEGRDPGS